MDEKYVNIIYNILSNDKNFAKNSPIDEFANKIKDEKYAKTVYDIISNWDPNFAENTNYDQYLIKVGANQVSESSFQVPNAFMKQREDIENKFIQEQEDTRKEILRLSKPEDISQQNVLLSEMKDLTPSELQKKKEDLTLKEYRQYQQSKQLEEEYTDSWSFKDMPKVEEQKKLKESIILERGFSTELADKLDKIIYTEDLYQISEKYDSETEKTFKNALSSLNVSDENFNYLLDQKDNSWMTKTTRKESEAYGGSYTMVEEPSEKFKEIFGENSTLLNVDIVSKKLKKIKSDLSKAISQRDRKRVEEGASFEKRKTHYYNQMSDNEIVKADNEDELYYLHWFDNEEDLITKGLEGDLLELASYYKEDVKNKKEERKAQEDSKYKSFWLNSNRDKVNSLIDTYLSNLDKDGAYSPGSKKSNWSTKEELVNDILEFEYLKNESNVIKDYISARQAKNPNEYQKKILSLVDEESKLWWLTKMYTDGDGEIIPYVFDEYSTIELDEDFKTLSYNMGNPGIMKNISKKYPELTNEDIQEIARDTYLIEQQNKLNGINNESLDKYISDFIGEEEVLVREAKSGYLTKDLINTLISDDVFKENTSDTTPEDIREDLERKLSPWGYRVYLSRGGDDWDKTQVTIKVIAPDGMGEFEAPVLQQGFGGALYIGNEEYVENEKNGVKFKSFITTTSAGRRFNLANITDIKPSDSLFAVQLKTNDQTLRTSIYSQNALKNRIEDAQNNLDRVSNQMIQNVSNEAMNIDYSPILSMYGINSAEFESTKQSINNQIEKIIQSGGGNEISSIQDIINSSLQGFIEGKLKTKRYSEDQLASIKQNSNQVFANVFNQLDNSLKNSSETINAMSNEIRYMQALDTKASEDYSLALAAKYKKDAKMGTKLGSLWNSFINGAEATFTGMVSTGLDIAALASTPFVAIEAAGKKKKVYDEETGEWTTRDVTFAEEWDSLSKSAKAQTLPFLRSFSDEFGLGTTDEYSAQWAEDSFWGLALQGLAGSALPMGMSMATGGVAGIPMFFGQAVEFQDQEIIKAQERGLLPEDMSELEKWATKAPMAIMMSILENYGARSFLTKGHVNKTNPFLVDLCRKNLKNLPKNSSFATFYKGMDKILSNSFARGSLRLAEGFLSEFETGFLQHMSDEAIKEIYDIFKSGDQSDIFTTSLQEGVMPFMKKAFISGLAEGVGGAKMGIISGIQTGIQYNKYGESLSDSQYELMEAIVQSAPSRQDYINTLNNRLKTDKNYTKEQYKQDLRRYDIAENTISQIPNSVTDYADRRKMFDLINEKRALNQQIKDKDSLFNSDKRDRIKEIDAEMKTIKEFGSKTESKAFDLSQNPNTSSYLMNTRSNKRKKLQLSFLLNKIQSHESGLEKLSQSEINDLISEVEILQKTFKKASNKTTRKVAGELQTIINNLKSGITSNTISMNQKMDQATQEKLSSENIGMYGNNNRETYIIDDEVVPRREFEEKLKNPEFVEKIMSGEISYSVVNASNNTIDNLKKQFPQAASKEKPGYKIYKDGTVHLNKASLSVAKNVALAKKIAKKLNIDFKVLNTREYASVLQDKGYNILNADGELDLEKVNASEGFFADSDGDFGTIYINEVTMRRNTSVGSHELLHGIFKKALTDGAIVTEAGMKAINQFKEILKEEGGWNVVKERIDQNYRFENFGGEGLTKEEFEEWKKQDFPGGTTNGNHIIEDSIKLNSKGNVIKVEWNENTYADEYLNAFSDAVVQKEIKYKKSIFDKVLDWFKSIGGNKVFEQADIKNGRQLYDYVLGYSEQFQDIDGDILLEEGDITPEVKVSEVTEPAKKVEEVKDEEKIEEEIVEAKDLEEMMSRDMGATEDVADEVEEETQEEVEEETKPIQLLDVTTLEKQDKQTTNAARGEYLDNFITQSKDWLRSSQDIKDTKEYKKVEKNYKAAVKEFLSGKKSARFSKSKPNLRFSLNLSKGQIAKANKDMKSFMNDLYKEYSAMWNDGGSDYAMNVITQNKVLDKFIVNLINRTVAKEKPPGWDSESESDLVQQTYIELIPHIRNFNKDFHDFKEGAIENDNFWGWVNSYIKKKLYSSFKNIGLKPAFEVDVTEAKNVVYEENQVAVEKIEKSLRKELGLDDAFKQRVIDKVKSVLRLKRLDPTSSKFKAALQEEFEGELFNIIREDVFGFEWTKRGGKEVLPFDETKYDRFIKKNFLAIYQKLPVSVLNKMTNLKTGESMVRTVINPKTGKQQRFEKTKTSQPGVFLKYNLDELTEIVDGDQVVKKEFLDYFINPKVSNVRKGKFSRMEQLAKKLAREIGFDATMEVLMDEKTYEEIKGKEVMEMNLENLRNNLEVISREIDRSPGLRFSKSGLRFSFNELNEYAESIYGKDNNAASRFINDATKMLDIAYENTLNYDQAVDKFKNTFPESTYEDIDEEGNVILKNKILDVLYDNDPDSFNKRSKDKKQTVIEDLISKSSHSKQKEYLQRAKDQNNKKDPEDTKKYAETLKKIIPLEFLNSMQKYLPKAFVDGLFGFSSATDQYTKSYLDIRQNKKVLSNEDKAKVDDLRYKRKKDYNNYRNNLIKARKIANAYYKTRFKLVNNQPSSKGYKQFKEKKGVKTFLEENATDINFYENTPSEVKIYENVMNTFNEAYNALNLFENGKISKNELSKKWKKFEQAVDKAEEHFRLKVPKAPYRKDKFMPARDVLETMLPAKKGTATDRRGRGERLNPIQKVPAFFNDLLQTRNQINELELKPVVVKEKGKHYDFYNNFFKSGFKAINENYNWIKDVISYRTNTGYLGELNKVESIEEFNETYSETTNRANFANNKLQLEIYKSQYENLLKNDSDWEGFVNFLNIQLSMTYGMRSLASLSLLQITDITERQFEHLNPYLWTYSEILNIFSEGLANNSDWNFIQSRVENVIKNNKAGYFTKDTSSKVDKALGNVSKLADLRMIAVIDKFNEIYSTNGQSNEQLKKQQLILNKFIKFISTRNSKSAKNNAQKFSKSKVVKVSESMSNEDILSLAATMDAALDLARNPDTPVKKIRVFDFDDTLAQTKSNVLYTMPDGTKGKLTAEEFAKKGDAMAAKGAQWDFSEFNKVMQGKKGPLFEIAERIQRARGTEDLFVLTARAPEAAPAIKEFLDGVGLNIPLKNITGLGNSSPYAKSQWVIEKAAEGYNDFYFADDHVVNVQAVQDALDQLTGIKSRTQVAIVRDEAFTEEQNMNKSIDSTTEEGSDGLLSIRFSKKNRDLYIKQLTKRRKDLLPEEIVFNVNQVFKFVDNLDVPQNKKKKFEKLALHYLANGYIILPEDGYKVVTAEKIATIKKLDPFSFKNPNEILELMPDELAKNSFDPDKTESFTNKKVLSNGVVVYDVAHTDQGQKDVRLAIDRDFGKKANPWCLAVKNEKGELSWDAKQRWQSYNDNGKGAGYKIAFQNGKLTALRDGSEKQWWDRMDRPSEGIPITRKAKDGWIEHVPVKEDGTEGKVRAKTKGNRNNGRYMEMISADELMYGSSNDFELVEDMTYKDGEPMDGFRKNYGSEDNFSLQEWVGGIKVKSLHDSTSEFVNNDHKETIYFGDKAISIKVDKATEEYVLNEKGERDDKIIHIIEGVDANGDRIVYKELEDTRIGGLAYPQTVYKELNGDKYLTQWDLNVNELFESVIYQTKDLTKDQLEAEYLKTNAAKVMSLEDFRSKGYGDDYLRSTIKNYKVTVGKAALDKNDKKIVIPVDEEGYSLRFSMNTKEEFEWKKTEKPGPEWEKQKALSYGTEFKVGDNKFIINMARMFEGEALASVNRITYREDIYELEGEYYDLDFAFIDSKGRPIVDMTGAMGNRAGRVLGIVANGVLDFVKKNKQIKGLYFSSALDKRTRIYKLMADIFGSELGWGYKTRKEEYGGGLEETNFIVSAELPVRKNLSGQRKPVRDVLRVIDKGSKTQTDLRFSKSNLNQTFNSIIEAKTGIAAERTFDEIAKGIGKNKGKYKFFMPYSSEDFIGLMYPLLAKGELGNKQMEWFNAVLFKPFARAMNNISRDRNQLMNDFRELKKNLKNVPKNLRKEAMPGLTYENAVRIYLWDKQGFSIPGLSEDTMAKVWELMQEQPELQAFADQLLSMNKGDGFAKPDQTWMSGTITTDLLRGLNTTKRAKYLQQWQKNVDIIFSKENLLKLEAAYGYKYVEALKDSLRRMKTGVNKKTAGNRVENLWLDWVNGSVGVTMFLNSRSALLQTISAINFVNWSDNNPIKAGKAFANQPRYWKDFMMLMNSEFLVDRRNGLRINVSESEIADAAATSTNKVRGVINLLLQKGFLLTQFADSFAIASGGATFYRNRLNTYLKEGLDQKTAEEKAFNDFRELAEESQQSSRPDRISMQQASNIGRVILAFANTPMQYNRLIKKAFLDLKNGRGDWKTNTSRIVYYGFIQNIIFNALQQALFALAFDDEEEEEKKKKYYGVANGMLDSILRGLGYAGAAIATVKSMAVKYYEESQKDRPKYENVAWEVLNISPPIDSKITKLRAAFRTLDYEMDEVKEQGFSFDQPAYMSIAQVLSAATNVPLDRLLKKAENIESAVNEDYETWQKVALWFGYSEWQIQTPEQKAQKKKEREEKKALRDPSRYNKEQQVDVLKQFNLSDSEIDKLNTEDKRVNKIKQLENQQNKQYKPRIEKKKRLSTEEKYNKAIKGLTKKEVQIFDKLEAIYALNKTEQVAILMKKEGLTKKWINGKYKTEVERVKRIYEIENAKNENVYSKWSEYRKKEEKPKQDKETIDAEALYDEIF